MSDVVLQLPKEGIVFMGDLFFVNRHPWLGDGDAASWQQHIQHFKENASLNKYVPGHGPIGDKAEMQLMENYLKDIQKLVKKGVEQHLPDSIIIEQPIPALYATWWYSRFYKPNLQFLCRQMRQ